MSPIKKKKMEILQKDNPILREVSSAIPQNKIDSKEVQSIMANLQSAIESQSDAIAISAIQIGKPIRLFVVSRKIFEILGEEPEIAKNKSDIIFINPKITKISKKKQLLEEGCLSVRYVYGKVSRPEKVTIEALDKNGNKFSRGFSGLMAQIVQHETDHLNGILFIDKAIDIQEITKEEYEMSLKS